jgi:hypothetical protein
MKTLKVGIMPAEQFRQRVLDIARLVNISLHQMSLKYGLVRLNL